MNSKRYIVGWLVGVGLAAGVIAAVITHPYKPPSHSATASPSPSASQSPVTRYRVLIEMPGPAIGQREIHTFDAAGTPTIAGGVLSFTLQNGHAIRTAGWPYLVEEGK